MTTAVTQRLQEWAPASSLREGKPAATPWSEESSSPAEDIRAFIRWYSSEQAQAAESSRQALQLALWAQQAWESAFMTSPVAVRGWGKRKAMADACAISHAMASLGLLTPSETELTTQLIRKPQPVRDSERSLQARGPVDWDLWQLDELCQGARSVVVYHRPSRQSLALALQSEVFRSATLSPADAATK